MFIICCKLHIQQPTKKQAICFLYQYKRILITLYLIFIIYIFSKYHKSKYIIPDIKIYLLIFISPTKNKHTSQIIYYCSQ